MFKINRYVNKGFGLFRAAGKLVSSKSDPIEQVFKGLARLPSVTIVQVGAYIGNSENDPIFKFVHRYARDFHKQGKPFVAVLVEPVKKYFETLKSNYDGCPNVYFENVAIAEERCTKDFYRLDADPTEFGYPAWLNEVGSLSPDRIHGLWDRSEQCLFKRKDKALSYKQFLAQHTVADKVECLALADLFDKYNITAIDMLQIDAEGYDYEILKTVDFDSITPSCINYERFHLHEQESECRAMLERAGYVLVNRAFMQGQPQDTLCILQDQAERQ